MYIRQCFTNKNQTTLKRTPHDIKWIIFHGDIGESPAGDITTRFNRRHGFSADFWIDTEGGIWQSNDYWEHYSWGLEADIKGGARQKNLKDAKNKNSINIVLCTEKGSDEKSPYTTETLDGAVKLIRYLLLELRHITKDSIIRRCEVDNHTDLQAIVFPGGRSQWENFKEELMNTNSPLCMHNSIANDYIPNYIDASDMITGTENEPAERMKILTEQLQEFYANIYLNQKMHELQSEIYRDRYDFLQTIQILLAAVTSAGIISIIFADEFFLKLLAAVFAMITTAISGYFKVYDLNAMAQKHKESALKLLDLRHRFLMLLCEIKMYRIDEQTAVEKRDAWMMEPEKVYDSAEDVSHMAYQHALRVLKEKDRYTFTEEEIKKMLPEYLRDDSK